MFKLLMSSTNRVSNNNPMNRLTISALITSCLLSALSPALAEPQLLDRVAVRVNNGVVLKSEVEQMVNDIKLRALKAGQSLPRDLVLKTQVTERLIDRQLQLATAERMGLKITDAQLDQALSNMAREEGTTIAKMRQSLEESGQSFQDYRRQFREELTIGEVTRIAVRNRIQISPQELDVLAQRLQDQSDSNREIHFGHIMVSADKNASKKEVEAAQQRIQQIRSLLDEGSDFRKQATTSSQGPKALEGGDWGWMNINEAPTIFAEALKGANKDELVGPIKSQIGFHILKVFDDRGVRTVEQKEMKARHILLKPSIILSESKAQTMLQKFSEQLKLDDSKFPELAKEYSDDPGSGSQGGELGWADPNMYVPEFNKMLHSLKPGEISAPFRTGHGWHIVQLQDTRTLDATKEHWKNRAYQMMTNRKFTEESQLWLKELRDSAYIEVIDQ